MIGHLYTIVNLLTGKEYIGKTYDTLDNRFKAHISKAKNGSESPLHKAIRFHGSDNFKIYLLDSYPEGDLELKEIEAISEYDTYKNGYNATLGGDGRRYINDQAILKEYLKTKIVAHIARNLRISEDTVKKVLISNKLEVIDKAEAKKLLSNSILLNNNIVFKSTIECAQYLIDNNISIVSNEQTQQGIRRVCQGHRKSYLKHKFKYI